MAIIYCHTVGFQVGNVDLKISVQPVSGRHIGGRFTITEIGHSLVDLFHDFVRLFS